MIKKYIKIDFDFSQPYFFKIKNNKHIYLVKYTYLIKYIEMYDNIFTKKLS